MNDDRIKQLTEIFNRLISEKNYRAIRAEALKLHPNDIAEIFEEMSSDDCVMLLRVMPKDAAAEVFSYISSQNRAILVSSMDERLLNHILNELYFDDKIDFLEDMPANFVKSILANATLEERDLINQFLNYPENSAGRLMTIEYADLRKSMTVRQALSRVKSTGMDKETIYTCYVLSEGRKLEGIISLRKLVLSNEDEYIEKIMEKDFFYAGTNDDQEDVADQFRKYGLSAMPVVDSEQRLIGIITVDDIMDVIEEENTEDFEKMAAMEPSDEDYLDAGVISLARKRIAWLLVLMISATFTGSIITHYEGLLNSATVLAAFIPMLMDSGGNAGSQSSTLVIRGMALGEIELKNWISVLWKEFRVSTLVGLALAVVNSGRMLIFGHNETPVVLTVSITLMFTIILAKLTGGVLPIIAKYLKLDPAIMAGPLITTVVDALSLCIYFAIARVFIL